MEEKRVGNKIFIETCKFVTNFRTGRPINITRGKYIPKIVKVLTSHKVLRVKNNHYYLTPVGRKIKELLILWKTKRKTYQDLIGRLA